MNNIIYIPDLPIYIWIGIFAAIWCCKLTKSLNLFDFIGDYLFSIQKKRPWFEKVNMFLKDCTACCSGQLCLWIWPIGVYFMGQNYNLIYHIQSILLAIFSGLIFEYAWRWIESKSNQI